jgi:hypothetical protein
MRSRLSRTPVRTPNRAALEAEFLRMCRVRGPQWIESVIRPLCLAGAAVTVQDIPTVALSAAVQTFGR